MKLSWALRKLFVQAGNYWQAALHCCHHYIAWLSKKGEAVIRCSKISTRCQLTCPSSTVNRQISLVHSPSIVVDTDIGTYITKLMERTQEKPDSSPAKATTWIECARKREMMNETILLGGKSGMDFPLGTVIPHPSTNAWIFNATLVLNLDLSIRAKDLSTTYHNLVATASC